ncbi:MAG: hypothetical protein Q4D31_02430 [Eubacteriales bacterium]|nr:hypothetical protein [Eubacteriales bacterium]
MKRKLIAMTLTLALAQAMAVPAFAAEGTVSQTDSSKTTNTTVEYTVKETYTVTIPQSVNLETLTHEQAISATDVVINEGNELKVTLSSANYSTGFRMKNIAVSSVGNADTDFLAYTIQKGSPASEAVTNGGEVLTVKAGTETGSETLTYNTTGKAKKAGIYQDTLTFTVSVDAATAASSESV